MLPPLATRSLKGSIHCLGAIPLTDLRPLVRAADIFLLPSLWENCPYSCLEAMAAGRAIVGANQGGMPELIEDGVNGLLPAANDAAEFARAIDEILEDAPRRSRLGLAARQTIVNAHRSEDTARHTLAVYQQAIAR